MSRARYITAIVTCLLAVQVTASELKRVTPQPEGIRQIITAEETRDVGINYSGMSIHEDAISQPETVISDGQRPDTLLVDNEAPAGTTPVCCYAFVFESNQVVLVDTEAETITYYGTLQDFFEQWYYEYHAAFQITEESGAYDETQRVVFDADMYADVGTGIGCDHTTAPFFGELPSMCSAPQEWHDYGISYGEETVGTVTTRYVADHRGMSSICFADDLSAGPYSVNVFLQPTVYETTCHQTGNGYGEIVAAGHRINTLGYYSRGGLGNNIHFSLLSDRRSDVPDFINDAWFTPPVVNESVMIQSNNFLAKTVEDENHQFNRRPAGATAYGGFYEEIVTGRYLQYGLLYGGHVSDEVTLCQYTDRFNNNPKVTYGAILGRDTVEQNGLTYSLAAQGRYGQRCEIARDGYKGIHTSYLLTAIGSVFSVDASGVGSGKRWVLPRDIESPREQDFWVLEDYQVPELREEAVLISYVLTALVPKEAP